MGPKSVPPGPLVSISKNQWSLFTEVVLDLKTSEYSEVVQTDLLRQGLPGQ